MKTKEELGALKDEFAALNKKLAALTDEELDQVIGGEDIHQKISDLAKNAFLIEKEATKDKLEEYIKRMKDYYTKIIR